MVPQWRVVDTGIASASHNIAVNRALLQARERGLAPNTLRFVRFRPAALVGFHQNTEQELELDYCVSRNIEVQRRITGGGAIYLDERQLGWELYLDRASLNTFDLEAATRRICEAAAAGIRRMGVNARFRPRNDIEVDGRKLSGTGGAFDGNAMLFQGTLLVDFDVEEMLRVLRISGDKLSDKSVRSARERVTSLRELLGGPPSMHELQRQIAAAFSNEFDADMQGADALTAPELKLVQEALEEIDSPAWVHQHQPPVSGACNVRGRTRCPGGAVEVAARLDTGRGVIKQVWFAGDFFIHPRRLVLDLEAALKDTPIRELRTNVHRFFERYPADMLLLGKDDFVAALEQALVEAGTLLPNRDWRV